MIRSSDIRRFFLTNRREIYARRTYRALTSLSHGLNTLLKHLKKAAKECLHTGLFTASNLLFSKVMEVDFSQSQNSNSYSGKLHLVKKNDLLSFIKEQKYKKIGLAGDHTSLFSFKKKLQSFCDLQVFSSTKSLYWLHNNRELDAIILLSTKESALEYYRKIVHVTRFAGDLIVPADRALVLPSAKIDSPKPTVFCAFPNAGTNRILPPFEYLCHKLKIECLPYEAFSTNICSIHHTAPFFMSKNQEHAGLYLTTFDEKLYEETNCAYRWRAKSLDYFQCLVIHDWFDIAAFSNLNCQVVALMRDPRDIISSFFWRTLHKVPLEKDDYLAKVLAGFTCYSFGGNGYVLHFPGIERITDMYLQALSQKNVHFIRFEDLHDSDVAATRNLFQNLHFHPNPFSGLEDRHFEKAAVYGTFGYQTKGKAKRGVDYLQKTIQKNASYTVSCRKGIVGDWKNTFPDNLIKHVEDTVGEKLGRIGYS